MDRGSKRCMHNEWPILKPLDNIRLEQTNRGGLNINSLNFIVSPTQILSTHIHFPFSCNVFSFYLVKQYNCSCIPSLMQLNCSCISSLMQLNRSCISSLMQLTANLYELALNFLCTELRYSWLVCQIQLKN